MIPVKSQDSFRDAVDRVDELERECIFARERIRWFLAQNAIDLKPYQWTILQALGNRLDTVVCRLGDNSRPLK